MGSKYREAKGLCKSCVRKSRPGKKTCEFCAEISRQHYLRKRESLRSLDPFELILQKCSLRYFGTTFRSGELRNLLFVQGNQCALSSMPIVLGDNAELDHIVPVSKGGSNDILNLQWTHKVTNRMKNDLSVEELILWCTRIIESSAKMAT